MSGQTVDAAATDTPDAERGTGSDNDASTIDDPDTAVDDTTTVVNPFRYTGPRTKESDSFALRPIVVERDRDRIPERLSDRIDHWVCVENSLCLKTPIPR